MENIDKLKEMYPDLDLLQSDGFDGAIIGIEPLLGKVVYNIDKMVEILTQKGLTTTDAIEYLDFNVLNSYVGEQTPIYIQIIEDYE